MKVAILLLALSISAVIATSSSTPSFDEFKNKHGKIYASAEEESTRKSVYEANMKTIAAHNAQYESGAKSFKLGENKYADLTESEFKSQLNGFKSSKKATQQTGIWSSIKASFSNFFNHNSRTTTTTTTTTPAPSNVAATVDWRLRNIVTPVKDQGQCGSCYAYAAIGAIESLFANKTGKLGSLSEEQIIDCSRSYGNLGCGGGDQILAFQYVQGNNGIDTESSYPYTASQGRSSNCKYSSANSAGTIKGNTQVLPAGSETALLNAVAIRPVAVAIDASHNSFQLYSSGVYNEPSCSSENLDHAVLVVGYGTTSSGQAYWLVKNSWGTSWGINGYIQMSRNKNNQCGIATEAAFPTA